MVEQRESGPFASFVLLSSPEWNLEQLKADLLSEWGITAQGEEESKTGGEESLIFDVEGMMVAVSLMPAPVPNKEAEQNAANNYLWSEAVEVTRSHLAHLLVVVLGKQGHSALDSATLWVKVTAACCKQKNSLGVYACGTVFEPGFYCQVADMIKEGEVPVLDLVYFGLYHSGKGMCAYTYGLRAFGKDEMEVLNTPAEPGELRDFLFDLVYYVIAQNATLSDGETIGFSAEQQLPITRSTSDVLDGMTLKIAYPTKG